VFLVRDSHTGGTPVPLPRVKKFVQAAKTRINSPLSLSTLKIASG